MIWLSRHPNRCYLTIRFPFVRYNDQPVIGITASSFSCQCSQKECVYLLHFCIQNIITTGFCVVGCTCIHNNRPRQLNVHLYRNHGNHDTFLCNCFCKELSRQVSRFINVSKNQVVVLDVISPISRNRSKQKLLESAY